MTRKIFSLMIVLLAVFALATIGFGQGKSKGRGNSSGNAKANRGMVSSGFPDSSQDESSRGRAKAGKKNSAGGDWDDTQKGNGGNSRFKGLAKQTGLSEEELQERFALEKRMNADLTYGQFVAANMISRNHSGFSTGDLLGGLRSGQSLGQVLQDKGWDRERIEKERKRIKKDREKNKDFDYNDYDNDWK